jgi:hypothetical protein
VLRRFGLFTEIAYGLLFIEPEDFVHFQDLVQLQVLSLWPRGSVVSRHLSASCQRASARKNNPHAGQALVKPLQDLKGHPHVFRNAAVEAHLGQLLAGVQQEDDGLGKVLRDIGDKLEHNWKSSPWIRSSGS